MRPACLSVTFMTIVEHGVAAQNFMLPVLDFFLCNAKPVWLTGRLTIAAENSVSVANEKALHWMILKLAELVAYTCVFVPMRINHSKQFSVGAKFLTYSPYQSSALRHLTVVQYSFRFRQTKTLAQKKNIMAEVCSCHPAGENNTISMSQALPVSKLDSVYKAQKLDSGIRNCGVKYKCGARSPSTRKDTIGL